MVLMLLLTVFMFSCATGASTYAPSMTRWGHPERSVRQQRADEDDCHLRAIQREHAWMARGASRLDRTQADFFDECMRDRGYSPVIR
jgi:hypothetical protein